MKDKTKKILYGILVGLATILFILIVLIILANGHLMMWEAHMPAREIITV